jgi:hypothetical protein
MAFGATSSVFREWNIQTLQVSGTGYTGLDSDTVKVALFNNSVTPDKDAAVASTGFNTGTWLLANEVTDATNWVSGGRALASKTFTTPATGVAMFDAADLAGGGNVTITNAYGCLVYDDTITAGTVADQGVCFNSFGGAASVTAGTFTVAWHANGIARWTSS